MTEVTLIAPITSASPPVLTNFLPLLSNVTSLLTTCLHVVLQIVFIIQDFFTLVTHRSLVPIVLIFHVICYIATETLLFTV